MSKHIVGPGGPTENNAIVVDTRGAILLENVVAAIAHLEPSSGQEAGSILAVDLGGRVNKTARYADTLYLMDGAGAANLCAQVMHTFVRNGQGEEFLALVREELRVADAEVAGEVSGASTGG